MKIAVGLVLGLSLLASTAQARTYQFLDDGVPVTLNETQAERLQNVFFGINSLDPCPWGPLVLWTFPTAPPPKFIDREILPPKPYVPPPPYYPPGGGGGRPAPVPEPGTWLLMLIGLASIAFGRKLSWFRGFGPPAFRGE